MSKTPQPIIRFRSYNPYEARYPGRRVVARETLHLIKLIRTQGYHVIVEPDDGSKLNYIAEKGLREFLADPVYAMIVGTSVSVIINLISSWLYDRLKDKPTLDRVSLILEFDEKGNKVRYDHEGKVIDDRLFLELLTSLNNRARQYKESLYMTPPNQFQQFPIYLEHTGKIVGWGSVAVDDKGLRVKNAKITDKETCRRLDNGEFNGFSVAGLVHNAVCSICNMQYVDCNHITGNSYDGVECVVNNQGIDLAEVSIVKSPVNTGAIIEKIY